MTKMFRFLIYNFLYSGRQVLLIYLLDIVFLYALSLFYKSTHKRITSAKDIQTYNLLTIPILFSQCFVEVKDFSEYRFALSEFVLQTDGQVELFICCQWYYNL